MNSIEKHKKRLDELLALQKKLDQLKEIIKMREKV